MFKQYLYMKNLLNKAEKPDGKPYYPYDFRNLYKTINQRSLFMNSTL